MAMYILANIPSVYIVERYGLRVSTIIGISLSTLGLWIRCLINFNYYTCLAGQIIIAIGQPFLYNAPAVVTTNWFPQKERAMSTMVGT